jgi:putative isomerase
MPLIRSPRRLQVALAVAISGLSIAPPRALAQSALAATPPALQAGVNRSRGPQAKVASAAYRRVQQRLARGWNTWDVNSVTTQVLLPEGLAIRVGMKHNTSENNDKFLGDTLIGRLDPGAEQVTPGPHAWDGSYTDLRVAWQGHNWRIQSAHDGDDLVLLATPLPSKSDSGLPPTLVFSVDFLWNRPGTVLHREDRMEARVSSRTIPIFCTCTESGAKQADPASDIPVAGPYFAAVFDNPVGISTGRPRSRDQIESIIERQRKLYAASVAAAGTKGPILDAIETTLGWDTIYEQGGKRVISPVSRVWCVNWGGYVLFDWDTFFAATLSSIGDRDLAYANAVEILREETPQGFVPNYARPGGWKSFDRSEPPVGAVTVLGLYRQFHDRWFLEETFDPLLKWNRWWPAHREIEGYLAWGSDGDTQPFNPDDRSRGTWQGAVYESGLDNSPMYDGAVYNPQTHLLEIADVGLMSLYIADCDALAEIADVLGKKLEAGELRQRATKFRASLATLWDRQSGIFLNKNLHTGEFSHRISPTNFYPLLAHAASYGQAKEMIDKHLLNPDEFRGEWVMPSIARDDSAFNDQNYWRGRIWGPMNYLVYLGLLNYDDADARREFAQKSYKLFLKEWTEKRHVHENYNAILGTGDDVASSDRFYHWGALLGYIEYLEESQAAH